MSGDSSQATENGLVWDAYSQVVAWIRSRAATNPFRRAGRALRVYGFGYSQTGGYLNTYAGALHRRVALENGGRPLFDAYLIGASGGAFVGLAPINQCAPLPPPGDPRYVIRNLGVPVIRAMTQTDFLPGVAARRADSDRRADPYRHYELAGAAHATPDELLYAAAPADIRRAGPAVPSLACDEGPRSPFPISAHFDALVRNLDLWVRRGVAPPRGRTDRRPGRPDGARPLRQRCRRCAIPRRRRAHEHVARQHDRPGVLRYRGPAAALLARTAAQPVPHAPRLRPRSQPRRPAAAAPSDSSRPPTPGA